MCGFASFVNDALFRFSTKLTCFCAFAAKCSSFQKEAQLMFIQLGNLKFYQAYSNVLSYLYILKNFVQNRCGNFVENSKQRPLKKP